jgi:NADH-quinone oxidoreductase subunit M
MRSLRKVLRRLFMLAILAALGFLARPPVPASAASHGARRLALSTSGGGTGPVDLAPGQAGWTGTFSVTNVGSEPLSVSRVAIRGSDDDVRSPARLNARFLDGPPTSATLPPGASRDVIITWLPAEGPHVRQALGHVIVTSNDEAQGEAAMGFRATLPTGLGWVGVHCLSLLILVPILVPLGVMARRLAGRCEERRARQLFAAAATGELALALVVFQRFLPGIGRGDGNDGFQAVERCVWVRSLGAEYFVGVDGISVALVLLVAMLALAATALPSARRTKDAYWAALALLVSATMLVLVALDIVLLYCAWVLVVVAIAMVVAGRGTAAAERASAKAAMTGTLGAATLLVALVALSLASGHAFLVDGMSIGHSMAIPELGRTNLAAMAPVLGVPFVDWVWGLLLVTVAATTPVVPLHGWLPDAIEEAPAGAGVLVAGVVVTLGPYLLVRVGLGAMPDGARWASSSIAAMGAIQVGYGACCALAQRSLRRFAAYTTMTHAGVALFCIGALSAQGVAGASSGEFAHGLAVATLLGAIAAAENQRGGSDLDDLRSLAHETPALALLLGFALAGSLGVPGVAWFWAVFVSLLAGFSRHPALAVVVAVGWVAFAAAHGRIVRTLVARPVASNHDEEPLDERVPRRKRTIPRALVYAALVPLVALSILLGVWPAPLLGISATAASDISGAIDGPGMGIVER